LKHFFEKPTYLVICVFGIAFVLLANVATNSIAFATSILDAAGQTHINHHDQIVRGIAIGLVAFSCIIHGSWRQGGIFLNNLLAFIKIGILMLIFILGILAFANVFPREAAARNNFSGVATFEGSDKVADAYGYAEGFLAILFAFGGLNQANYVMGEIDDPRRRYKWPAFSAVAIVSLLYILVNISYFIVVPAADFGKVTTSSNVAHRFFELTLGKIDSPWAPKAPQMLSAFMAISSLGNVVVMTYTAARVKQEIAKEGILPFRAFLSKGTRALQFPIQKLWSWRKRVEQLPEDVPVGALCLHFLMSVVLLLGTWPLTTADTYVLLVDLYSYVIDATFGSCLGFGLLYM
jgi:amino acid transporter